MNREHFKKRQNAHIFTKKGQNFRKSDKRQNCATNADKATKHCENGNPAHDSCGSGTQKDSFIYCLRVGNKRIVGEGGIKMLHKKKTMRFGDVVVFVVVQLELRLMPAGVHKLRPLV